MDKKIGDTKIRTLSMACYLKHVEDQFNMGGLSDGLYAEYANDVAISFAFDLLHKLKDEGVLKMNESQIYDLLNNGKQVEQAEN